MKERVAAKRETGKTVSIMKRHAISPLWNSEKKYSKTDYLYRAYKKKIKDPVSEREFKAIIHKFNKIVLRKVATDKDGASFSGITIQVKGIDSTMKKKGFHMKPHNMCFSVDLKIRRKWENKVKTKHLSMYMNRTLRTLLWKSKNVSDFLVHNDNKYNTDFDYDNMFD